MKQACIRIGQAFLFSFFVIVLLMFFYGDILLNPNSYFIKVYSWLLLEMESFVEYFTCSHWILNPVNIFSTSACAYPLGGDILIGFPRLLAILFVKMNILKNEISAFRLAWIFLGGLGFFLCLGQLWRFDNSLRRDFSFIMLIPLVAVFSLIRFDIVPTLFCLWALIFLSCQRYQMSAISWGAAAAIKGFPILLYPIIIMHFYKMLPKRKFFLSLINLFLLPFLASLLMASFADGNAFLGPYWKQSHHPIDAKSIYSVVNYFYRGTNDSTLPRELIWGLAYAPVVLITGIHLCRRSYLSFEGLRYSIFGILNAFIMGSYFLGPQYLIWIIPFFSSGSRGERYLFATKAMLFLMMYSRYFIPFSYLEEYSRPAILPLVGNIGFAILFLLGLMQVVLHGYLTLRSRKLSIVA